MKAISIDAYLDKSIPLLLLLLLVVVLRIPNFFEPYWYGDEAIYLTIGHVLSQGGQLYVDVVDHKTPLIYYLAMVPTQFWFRVLLLGWMLITTTAFYYLATKLFKKTWLASFASFVFVVLTTVPWLEGNIPNGELFVMGFIMVGSTFLTKTSAFSKVMYSESTTTERIKKTNQSLKDRILYISTGIFFGLAMLTKVPAVFDAVAFIALICLAFSNQIALPKLFTKPLKKQLSLLLFALRASAYVIGGIVVTILASILYYLYRGTLEAYLEFGLLYNFHYVQTWGLNIDNPFLAFSFTMPGKFIITTSVVLLAILLKKWIKPRMQFILIWFSLSLFASLLSNRPYPHYFLQVVPALALLTAELAHYDIQILQKFVHKIIGKKTQLKKTMSFTSYGVSATFGATLFAILVVVLVTLQVGFYPTQSYYQRSFKYLTGQISEAEYKQKFSSRLADNYRAAQIIRQSPDPYLFIWGTNPELYALAQKQPVGRFTVSFHIKDLNVHEETAQAVLEYRPQFIVVMKNERDTLPNLKQLLMTEYTVNSNFYYFDLWKRNTQYDSLNDIL